MLKDVSKVKKYDVFERVFTGKTDGNPFIDYDIKAVFKGEHEEVEVNGFYDGFGNYVVRFMPSYEGMYEYTVTGSFADEAYSGTIKVTAADKKNHGPVRVTDKFHFSYDDGTPYYSVGTTCYVWELREDKLISETLKSLDKAGFNKIRFCIFPKHYVYNLDEPRSYPFEGTPVGSYLITPDNFMDYDYKTVGNNWDFDRFNPAHFQHIEKCIKELKKIGVEADLIVFHPYDRWGFSNLPREVEVRYLDYIINRFAAYSNVWWSMANEFDILPNRDDSVWSFYGNYFKEHDPYGHLRSIHNCLRVFDHSEPWITHVSYQRTDLYKTAEDTDGLRDKYGKPVVLDEIAYEGNIQCGWGNIPGEEMVRRFWEGAMRGGYPGHGETFLNDEGILWWSHGGKLRGESWKRVKFLLKILSETPGHGLKKVPAEWDCVTAVCEDDALEAETGYRIDYYSFMRPGYREFNIKDDSLYEVELIDTWDMTVKKVGTFSGKFKIELPGKPYMAIRLKKVLK
ncbi:MAG: DUF5605 domain-containing protein [Lachnospiraceae bacterium]|nr:DUF5605 domain-containing protein [Lachnospiraceae bacterium]